MTEKSLYELLGVEKDATQDEIKKAYRKLALQLHPDRNPGDAEATSKFQSLQKIYTILGDADKRKLYDDTGCTDEDGLAGQDISELYTYFRAMFKEVTTEYILAFEAKYRGSEEEQQELLQLYAKHRGSMARVFDCLVCSDPERDSHRFMDAIEAAIAKGDAKKYKAFSSWAKQTAARPRPADPLKPRKVPKKAQDDMAALQLAIRQKSASAVNNIADALAAKYGGVSKAGSGAKKRRGAAAAAVMMDEPSEEQFAAAQLRMAARMAENKAPAGSSKGSKGSKSKK